MLSVGIPKEIKPLEKRVGLIPSAVSAFCKQGIFVRVQAGAGDASGYSDDDYQRAGAQIAATAEEVYQADFIQKVKEPQAAEFPFLRRDQILFCFLHLASPENAGLVRALTESGAGAIAYEGVEKDNRDRKSTRLNSSHSDRSRMPSSA